MAKLIELRDVYKIYSEGLESEVRALDGVSLTIEKGEFVAIVGQSGSGKSTMMNVLGCLDVPTYGEYLLEGTDVSELSDMQLSRIRNKEIGFIFQQYNLIQSLSVQENVELPLVYQGIGIDDRHELAIEALERVGLVDRRRNKPTQMSGGQQQRVAIARTLAPEPSVLFMDEPLSNLDAKLRLEMRYELQRLHVETGSTFVYVTHDQMEAMTLATQICLINNGVLQQYEPPLTVYNHPQNLFVADFVGNPSINFVEAKGAQQPDGSITLEILGGVKAVFRPREGLDLAAWFAERDRKAAAHAAERLAKSQEKGYVEKGNKDEPFRYHIAKVEEEDDSLQEDPVLTNEDLVLGIRPEFLNITNEAPLKGEIYGAMPTGMESTIKVYVNGFLLTGVVFGSSLFTIGQQHSVSFTGHHIMLFDRQSGDCIALGSLETL